MGNSFWSDAVIEPKRQYRWLAYIGGMDPILCKKFSKPKVVVGETELKFLNHSFWYPGRATWDAVSLTLVDPVEPDAAGIMFGKLMNSGYKYPDTFSNSVSTISKAKSVEGLGNVQIVQLGARAGSADHTNPVESWTLKNAWIKDIAFGELDYEQDGMVDIVVTLRYDYAELKTRPMPKAQADAQDGKKFGKSIKDQGSVAAENPQLSSEP